MVRLALLWHMHQPNYEDLATGEHILPWVRLHAIKDYWGMVATLTDFPRVRVTFNLVPSLLAQIDAFAADRANDRHLRIGLQPADALTGDERAYLTANGFHASFDRMIRPHARYAELHARRASPQSFSTADIRDLQVWHKLVWIDPDWLARDARLVELVARQKNYTEDDKATLRAIELELIHAVVPAYQKAAASGRVELSTSPFYHPILPLLCNTDVHFRAHPHSALPRQLYAYRDDARAQLVRAFDLHVKTFGSRPAGVWPSEGAISDEAISVLDEQGCAWTASDEAILAKSLGRPVSASDLYRPYRVGEAAVRVLFRDHRLSDLIGFVYQSWEAETAADHFIGELRKAGERFRTGGGGEVATVSVILDGENAWEHYAGGGRPFLRALYQRLENATDIETVTMSEAAASPARELASVFPGSWIDGDLYVWAGHRDDHRAWAQLAAARRAFDAAASQVAAAAREQAWEEILIAEGSDWFWWYGDDHSSAHDREFDELFRRHVANVYRAFGQSPPDELQFTNITTAAAAPLGKLRLTRLSSRPLDAGSSDVDWLGTPVIGLGRQSAMHQVTAPRIDRFRVSADARHLFLRAEGSGVASVASELDSRRMSLALLVESPTQRRVAMESCPSRNPSSTADQVVVVRATFAALGANPGDLLRFAVQLEGATEGTLERHPREGFVELTVPDERTATASWLV